MIRIDDLVAYLDALLLPQQFKDYCPNGLQVAGKSMATTIVTGVTANQALIDAAIEVHADVLLVHHGFFWKGESATITGLKYNRIKSLIKNDINLLAYHLPLDAHTLYGNNVQLGKILDIDFIETFEVEPGLFLGNKGQLRLPVSGEELSQIISNKLSRTPLYIKGKSDFISSIAWCTGAAQDYILSAVEQEVDAFLTGEVSERTFHLARETGIHFYAAGHHATERYGILALGEHLSKQFGLKHFYIDIDNPV